MPGHYKTFSPSKQPIHELRNLESFIVNISTILLSRMTTNLMIVIIMGRNSSFYTNNENGGHCHGK